MDRRRVVVHLQLTSSETAKDLEDHITHALALPGIEMIHAVTVEEIQPEKPLPVVKTPEPLKKDIPRGPQDH